jgi:hypothetical protein
LTVLDASVALTVTLSVGHFAINYHNEANALGIDLDELYAAQIAGAEVNTPE